MIDTLERTAPPVTPDTAAFWRGCSDRILLVRSCRACGKAHYYPRARCPYCFSEDLDWVQASGRGTVHSFSVMRRASPPYVTAYVTLPEGITMLTNLVDTDPEAVRIGSSVVLAFEAAKDGQLVPVFRLAPSP